MRVTIPNLLSLFRMGLVPVFVLAVVQQRPLAALLIFGVAGVTDALDGAIARALQQRSLLGAYLDPIADKLLLMSAYVVLAIPGLQSGFVIPLWVTILVLSRDLLILVIAVVLHLTLGVRRFPPSVLSKVNTAVQISVAVLVLASGLEAGLDEAARWGSFLVGVLTVASGVGYLVHAGRIAGEEG